MYFQRSMKKIAKLPQKLGFVHMAKRIYHAHHRFFKNRSHVASVNRTIILCRSSPLDSTRSPCNLYIVPLSYPFHTAEITALYPPRELLRVCAHVVGLQNKICTNCCGFCRVVKSVINPQQNPQHLVRISAQIFFANLLRIRTLTL